MVRQRDRMLLQGIEDASAFPATLAGIGFKRACRPQHARSCQAIPVGQKDGRANHPTSLTSSV
jgi:hypothetical protein